MAFKKSAKSNQKEKKFSAETLSTSRRNINANAFTDDEDDDSLSYGSTISNSKVVSTDRDVKSKVILQTFIGDEVLSSPNEIDTFISNSLELASKKENFIPWLPTRFSKDDFIEKAIAEAESGNEYLDTIDDSGIIDVSKKRQLEVE